MKEKAAALADAGSTESAVEIAKAAADTAVGDGSSTQPVAQKKKAKTRKAKVRFCLSLFALASFCFCAGVHALHGARHHRVPEEKRRHGPDHEMEVQQVRQDGATVRRCNWILVRPPQLLKLRGVGANIQI